MQRQRSWWLFFKVPQARGGEPRTTRGKPGLPGLAALGFLGNILTSLVTEDGRTKEEEWVGWSYRLRGGSPDNNLIAKCKLSKPANAAHLKNL